MTPGDALSLLLFLCIVGFVVYLLLDGWLARRRDAKVRAAEQKTAADVESKVVASADADAEALTSTIEQEHAAAEKEDAVTAANRIITGGGKGPGVIGLLVALSFAGLARADDVVHAPAHTIVDGPPPCVRAPDGEHIVCESAGFGALIQKYLDVEQARDLCLVRERKADVDLDAARTHTKALESLPPPAPSAGWTVTAGVGVGAAVVAVLVTLLATHR